LFLLFPSAVTIGDYFSVHKSGDKGVAMFLAKIFQEGDYIAYVPDYDRLGGERYLPEALKLQVHTLRQSLDDSPRRIHLVSFDSGSVTRTDGTVRQAGYSAGKAEMDANWVLVTYTKQVNHCPISGGAGTASR
jgi:hypothetical protein